MIAWEPSPYFEESPMTMTKKRTRNRRTTMMRMMKRMMATNRATTEATVIRNDGGCPRFAPFFGANLGSYAKLAIALLFAGYWLTSCIMCSG